MDGGLHGRGWCKGFIYVWDKRFLILNSGWDCSGYSAAYDCSSGADFWQDGASSWWGVIDQMRAEKFSLVKQGQVKSRSHWCIANGICLAVKDQVSIMQIWYCSIFRCFCTGLGCWNVFHTYFTSLKNQISNLCMYRKDVKRLSMKNSLPLVMPNFPIKSNTTLEPWPKPLFSILVCAQQYGSNVTRAPVDVHRLHTLYP